MPQRIRVLLCDDQQMVRSRVRSFLTLAEDVQVVGEAGGGLEGVQLALQLQPDLVLMDVNMKDMDGIAATRKILAADPSIRVLMFSAEWQRRLVEEALAAGARGYLLKTGDPELLLDAIRSAAGNGARSQPVAAQPRVLDGRARRTWQIGFLAQDATVVITARGSLTHQDAKAQAEHSVRSLREHQSARLLLDFSEAEFLISFANLYWLPRYYDELEVPRHSRIAVVGPSPANRLDACQFYVLTCTNAGYNMKLFDSRESALAWLRSPVPRTPQTCP